jgi:hypothetical protein
LLAETKASNVPSFSKLLFFSFKRLAAEDFIHSSIYFLVAELNTFPTKFQSCIGKTGEKCLGNTFCFLENKQTNQ